MDIQDNVLYLKVDKAILHINAAYDAINDKGGTIPASKTISNLIDSIDSIVAGNGETIEQLVDSKNVYANNYTYTKTPDLTNVSGYSSVTINGSVMISNYNIGDLYIDTLVKNATNNDYVMSKTSDNMFASKAIATIHTNYPGILEQTLSLDTTELVKMSSFKIPIGFHSTTETDYMIDDSSLDNFITTLLVSNMNDNITNNFTSKFVSIIYDYADYNVANLMITDVSVYKYGHRTVVASNFSQYASFDDMIANIGNMLGYCHLSSAQLVSDYLANNIVTEFNMYRIIYNVNIFMNDSACYDNNIFLPANKLLIYKTDRLQNIKTKFANLTLFKSLTDIIDENNMRVDYRFSNVN